MIRINLLPRRRRGVALPRIGLVAAVALVILAFAGGTVLLAYRNDRLRGQIADLDTQISELRPQVEEVTRLLRDIQDLRKKEAIIAELEAKRLPWAPILVDVSDRVPRDVWLASILSEGPAQIGMGGHALSFSAIAAFMRNLEASPMFEGVDLTTATRADIGGRKVIGFGLTMRLSLPQTAEQPGATDGAHP